MLGTRWYNF